MQRIFGGNNNRNYDALGCTYKDGRRLRPYGAIELIRFLSFNARQVARNNIALFFRGIFYSTMRYFVNRGLLNVANYRRMRARVQASVYPVTQIPYRCSIFKLHATRVSEPLGIQATKVFRAHITITFRTILHMVILLTIFHAIFLSGFYFNIYNDPSNIYG